MPLQPGKELEFPGIGRAILRQNTARIICHESNFDAVIDPLIEKHYPDRQQSGIVLLASHVILLTFARKTHDNATF